jgi:hypothetical protein
VIGGIAYLPKDLDDKSKDKETVSGGSCMEGVDMIDPAPDLVLTLPRDPVTSPRVDSSESPFYNLAVEQKETYQSVFRHRRWLENEKRLVPESEEKSVADIERRLPPLRGQSASVVNYVEELELFERRLKEFYAGDDNRFKEHKWDQKRAMQAEYQALAARL